MTYRQITFEERYTVGVLRQCGIGAVRVAEGVDRRQLQVFVSLLLSYAATDPAPGKIYDLGEKMTAGGISRITIEPPLETEENVEETERQKEAAKRTYTRSVAVTREVVNSLRMGRSANVKKVKRAVQAIVERHGLRAAPLDRIVLWDYGDYVFRPEWDIMSAMDKARRCGFALRVDTTEMFARVFKGYREARIIP